MQWAIAKAILKRAILSYFEVQWQENRRKAAQRPEPSQALRNPKVAAKVLFESVQLVAKLKRERRGLALPNNADLNEA